jgi:CO/xanthine dehydrogenase FAD-binding subunit
MAHADPAAEWPAVALALGAEIDVTSARGRRTIAAEDFFVTHLTTALEPDELVTEVRLPLPLGPSCFLELSRRAGDFALCGVAATQTRTALCGVADRPVLVDDSTFDSIADPYRRQVAPVLVRRALERIRG